MEREIGKGGIRGSRDKGTEQSGGSGGSLGGSCERAKISDQLIQLGVGELLLVIGGHGRALFVDDRLEFGFGPGVNFFLVVHKLERKGVFVEDDAGEFSSLLGGDGDKFVGGRIDTKVRGDEAFGNDDVGRADGFDEVVARTHGADAGKVGAEASALAGDHMAAGAIGFAEEEFPAGFGVARSRSGSGFLEAAKISDDVASFGFVDIVGGHGGAGNAVKDVVEQSFVGVAVIEMAGDEARGARAAAGVEAVAEGAGVAEGGFAVFDLRSGW